MPIRIQRKRTKGWKMPEDAVCVSRPSKWSNPFTIEKYGRRLALFNFRQRMVNLNLVDPTAFHELRGKDLVCWCPLCEKHKDGKPAHEACEECNPCHVDVLFEFANPDYSGAAYLETVTEEGCL